MNKILLINACVRPKSRTYQLAKHVLQQLDGTVEEVNLEKTNLQPLNQTTLKERGTHEAAKDFSAPMFSCARQFAEADEIVVAAPYWDLAFPSTVRIYFEAVTVCGLTFCYSPEGTALGLCKAKRLIYVTTAGGSIGEYNLGYDYVKALSSVFYGIPDFLCFQAENLDIKGADVDGIMKKAMDEIKL